MTLGWLKPAQLAIIYKRSDSTPLSRSNEVQLTVALTTCKCQIRPELELPKKGVPKKVARELAINCVFSSLMKQVLKGSSKPRGSLNAV